MEFKKTTRHSARLAVPRRADSLPHIPPPHSHAQPLSQTITQHAPSVGATMRHATIPPSNVAGPALPQVKLPTIQLSKVRIDHAFLGKKVGFAAVIIVIFTVVTVAVGSFVNQQNNAKNNASANYATKTYQNPDFQTVLPNGKSVGQFGGWQRVSPVGKDPVFAYADSVNGVAVSVSEQPLPAALRADPSDQVASLAEKFNATDQIAAGDTTVHVGTSAKGPQSAVLTKNDLLILIKSASKIADTSWANYVESLN